MKGDRNQARRLSPRSLRCGSVVVGLVVAMATIAAETPSSPGQTRRIGTESATPAGISQLAARVRSSHLVKTNGESNAPCTAPPLPAATNPPGANYGVPFVAEISGGDLLGGYDLHIAKHGGNPWRAKISNITGWISGLLEVPTLQAKIDQLFFCNQGQKPPAGVILELVTPGAPTTTNVGSCTTPPTPGFVDFRVTLTLDPTVPTTLAITGVEPDGSIDLSGLTSASTKIDQYDCPTPPQPTQTCIQFGPTQIPLSTRLGRAPIGAPPHIVYPLTPGALQGPINSGKATLVGNNFAVPAFKDFTQPAGCFDSILLNSALAGFDSRGISRYPQTEPQPQIAGQAGWSEFQARTQIRALG